MATEKVLEEEVHNVDAEPVEDKEVPPAEEEKEKEDKESRRRRRTSMSSTRTCSPSSPTTSSLSVPWPRGPDPN